MHSIEIAVALSAATVILLGAFSAWIERLPVSIPLMALGVGVLAGPYGLGWLDPASWSHPHRILKEVAHAALAISVLGIAIRTPPESYRRWLRPVVLLLTLGMVLMWLISSLLVWSLLGLAPLVALSIGAAVAPTDPVVATSIVTGPAAEENLPDRVRSILSLESGANDGLGYLLYLLPVILMGATGTAAGIADWFLRGVLQGVLLAAVGGAALGWAAARLVTWAEARHAVEKHSELSLSVALSLLALTGAKLLGSDGILAAFAAGAAFNLSASRSADFAEENVQESISKLFNIPVFVLLGIALPVAHWTAFGAPLAIFAAAILLLRRPVAMLLLAPLMGRGLGRRELGFLGWFGPIGVAAIFYALEAMEHTGEAAIWHATSLVIAASILIHGVTAAPGMALYRRSGR